MHPMFIAALFTVAKTWKQPVSFDRWLDKEVVVHICNAIPLSHKKDEILPFTTTWMDLENIMLSKISQSEKAKKTHNFIHMWDIKLKLIDTDNSMVVTRGKRSGWDSKE